MKTVYFTAIALLFISLCVSADTIYKKVNQDGSVAYSDQPFAGAQAINVTISKQTQLPTTHSLSNRHTTKSAHNALPAYAIGITSPLNGQTVRNNNGELTIMVQTTPQFDDNYLIQIFINNTPHSEPSQLTVFKLKNIDRGEIKIKVQLLTIDGNILATSPETLVYLHRATVN